MFHLNRFQTNGLLLLVIVFLFAPIEVGYCTANLRQVEKRILDDIIGEGKYDSRIRPSGINQTSGKDGPANVTINLLVRSISSIDDVTMSTAP
ncbi:hypothetical protein RDWZM_004458 [Blomia tropicalis]|uniref:Uncharacterized protein n=1 Tax=Blomia tropicalis TaxID=40697 RepID=A0A9Q0MIW0_BLOTA|nr:hypothetical protein RDWZM_004458 [Blomia tropicalis]